MRNLFYKIWNFYNQTKLNLALDALKCNMRKTECTKMRSIHYCNENIKTDESLTILPETNSKLLIKFGFLSLFYIF